MAVLLIAVVISPPLAGTAPALAGTAPAPAGSAPTPAGTAAQGVSTQRASEPAASSSISPDLHTLLSDVTAAGVPGVMIRVQDHDRIRQVAAGVTDLATGAALRPQAKVRIGSITKTFVATVALELVGEGRLALDRPVKRWLPGLLRDGSTITVRQLLNHTSGLFDYTADPKLLAGITANRFFDPADLVAIAETHPSSFTPGTAWAYSNTNYIVAGLLIQAVTHHSLGEELDRRIFRPLSLADTSFPAATGNIPGYHARGYVPPDLIPAADGGPFDVTGLNPSHAWAAGAIVSTVKDVSRFYQALMDGELLNARMLRQMKTTTVEDAADPGFRYGLGIERVSDRCGVNWGHSGAIFGYQAMAFWNEDTARTVTMASTIYPAPPTAAAALTTAADQAPCGTPRS